jgi:hypothetical protein
MHQGKFVFSQLMAYLRLSTFARCVSTRQGEHKVKDFSCLDQFFAMAFAQLTYRESLRDIEVNVLDELVIEPGAFYLLDRGYLDFSRLFAIHQARGFFVTRAKSNTQFRRRYSNPVKRDSTSVVCDQSGVLTVFYSSKDYPQALRRVVVKDEAGKRVTFLTNNFALKPELIADQYRQRWQVELFFKWIKQHLRIKAFLGTSENAVKTQIWIAVCTYVLIAIVKKRLHLPHSLYEILQILSLTHV